MKGDLLDQQPDLQKVVRDLGTQIANLTIENALLRSLLKEEEDGSPDKGQEVGD